MIPFDKMFDRYLLNIKVFQFFVYYPRTIHAMFALNWLTGFRREDF
jgi:hypothetical protein